MRWVLFVMLFVIAGCGSSEAGGPPPTATPEPPCSTSDGDVVYELFDSFSQEWDDAMAVAQSTSRMSLAGPVGTLQSIRREVQQQEWPDCAADAHDHLVNAMDGFIDGMLAFMQDESEYDVSQIIKDAAGEQKLFFAEMIKLQPSATE